jgi:uncharacterized membrane protein
MFPNALAAALMPNHVMGTARELARTGHRRTSHFFTPSSTSASQGGAILRAKGEMTMLGFLFGTLCLFGLVGAARRHYYYGAYGGSCGGGYRGYRGGHSHWRESGWRESGPTGDGRTAWVGDERFARAAGEVLKRRLRVKEDQEAIIDHALTDLHASLKELRTNVKDSREELANAFRGEKVDDAQLAVLFDRWSDALTQARQDTTSALKQIHAVLDPEQRTRAADWLGKNPEWV